MAPPASYAAGALAAGSYMLIGPLLIVLNNSILHDSFAYPGLLSGLGVGTTAVFTRLVVYAGFVKVEVSEVQSWHGWCRRVVPVALGNAITLTCGNAAYLYLHVGHIQMLKPFTCIFVVLLLLVCRVGARPSLRTILSVMVIAFGSMATVVGELDKGRVVSTVTATPTSLFTTHTGYWLILLSEGAEATRLVMTQNLLQGLKFTIWEAQYVLAPTTAAVMLFIACFHELPALYAEQALGLTIVPWRELCMASLLGVGVQFAGFAVIQTLGSVVLKSLGTVRNLGLVAFSFVFLQESLAVTQAVGYALSLVGLQYYMKYKHEDHERANANATSNGPTTGTAKVPSGGRRVTRSVGVGSRNDSKDPTNAGGRYQFGRSRSTAGMVAGSGTANGIVIANEESRELLLDGGRGEEEEV